MLKKFLKTRQGKKLVLCFLVMAAVIGLGIYAIRSISFMVDSYDFPDGEITDIIVGSPLYREEEEFSRYIKCPTLPYSIAAPVSSVFKGDYVKGVVGNVTFVITETESNLSELMKRELHGIVNQSVFGRKVSFKQMKADRGYLYDLPAEYMAGVVSTKVSIRNVVTYVVAYSMKISESKNIVIYASSEERTDLMWMEQMLRNMSLSISKENDVEEEMTQDVELDNNEIELFEEESEEVFEDVPEDEYVYKHKVTMEIDYDTELEYSLNDGVCIFRWTNVGTCPEELYIVNEEGIGFGISEIYSNIGAYVFLIGKCEPGTFRFTGGTEKPLNGVRVSFLEWDDFFADWNEKFEEPIIIPHG